MGFTAEGRGSHEPLKLENFFQLKLEEEAEGLEVRRALYLPVLEGGMWEAWARVSGSSKSKDGPPPTAREAVGRSVLQLHRTELGKDPNDLGNSFFPELSDQADPLIFALKNLEQRT